MERLLFVCCVLMWFDPVILFDGCTLNQTQRACSHICTEQTDDYMCTCKDGYILNTKKYTCEVEGDAPVLFYQKATSLYVLYTDTKDHFIVMKNIGHIKTMGFGPNNTLFWIEKDTLAVYRMKFDEDFHGSEWTVVIDSGLKNPSGLAVDCISSILYILDYGRLIACSIKGENCSVILSDLVQPRDLTIYHQNRQLMWIGQGHTEKDMSTLHMSELNGNGHKVLLKGLKSPHSLVIDETMDALFWLSVENSETIIQMMFLKQHHIVTVLKLLEESETGLSVLGDYIYVWNEDEVRVIDKFDGNTTEMFDIHGSQTALVYHPILYNSKLATNPCVGSSCSHLCLPGSSQSDKYNCPCPVYMEHSSPTHCTEKLVQKRIFVSGVKGIFEIPLNFIGQSEEGVRQLTNQSAECLAYNSVSGQFLFYDSLQQVIMSMQISDPKSTIKKLFTNVKYLEAIAVNEKDNIVYWTSLEGVIYTGSLTGTSKPEVLYSGFSNPRGMAVDEGKRVMYLCDWGKDPQIIRCDLDGTKCVTIFKVPNGHPNMITLENGNQLYWTDSKADRIVSLELDTSNRMEIKISGEKNPHPYCIGTTRKRVYFTDWNTKQLHYIEKSTKLIYNIELNVGTLFGLVIISPGDNNVMSKVNRTIQRTTQTVVILKQDEGDIGLVVLVIFLVAGLSLIVVLVTWICFCRRKRVKDTWLLRLVKFVKPQDKMGDDDEELLSSADFSDPSFKHFQDLDYPDYPTFTNTRLDMNKNGRNVSMESTDSAFNEMQESPTTVCQVDERTY